MIWVLDSVIISFYHRFFLLPREKTTVDININIFHKFFCKEYTDSINN